METGVKLSQGLFICFWLFALAQGNSRIVSSYGGLCIDECDRRGRSYFYCDTTSAAQAARWDYCSPIPGISSYGHHCRNTCDRHDGTSYYWCKTDGGWDYCSLYDNGPSKIIVGSRGGICLDECTFNGLSYRHCKTTLRSWDYCSPFDGIGAYGHKCSTPCMPDSGADRNHKYSFCYTKDGSWDYCSLAEFNGAMTRYGQFCLSPCESDDTYYNFCYTWASYEYCPPKPRQTYLGRNCKPDSVCDKRGKSYYWCWVDDANWDYCGPYEDCAYWPYYNTSHAGRERRRATRNICSLTYQGNRLLIFADASNQNRSIQLIPRENRREVSKMISQLDKSYFENNIPTQTIRSASSFRIRIQGSFPGNGRSYVSIQVQKVRYNHEAFAGIMVRADTLFTVRAVRRALSESMDRGQTLYLDRGST